MRDTKVKVEIAGEEYEFSTAEELGIDRDNLDEAITQQAASFAWFMVLRERARSHAAMLAASLKDLEAELDERVRLQLVEAGAKVTEVKVKATIRSHPERRSLQMRLDKAEQVENLVGAFSSAFIQRKDLLISLSRSRAYEMAMPSALEVQRMKDNLKGTRS